MNIQEIRDNAPDGAEFWRDMDSICSPNEILYYCFVFGVWLVFDEDKNKWIKSIISKENDYILDQLKPLY